ncbi:MAG TPA: agmatine deiminase family protein [Bacteroidia bacterium]|nr:agmatine deiminase family protein [Bacteroidia bacterium]
MKKLLLAFLFLSTATLAQLPNYMTEEEKLMMDDYLINARGLNKKAMMTNPPASPVRTSAEWEEIDGLMVAWAGYSDILREIVRAARLETQVYIICGPSCNATDSTAIKNYLTGGGVPLSNINFVYTGCNSIWSRDYGQWNVYTNDVDSLLLIDWIYNRPRPLDDAVPQTIASLFNLPLFNMNQPPNDLCNTGGNFMVDGFGTGFASNLVVNENDGNGPYSINYPNHTIAEIDTLMNDFMGLTRYIKMTILLFDGIHHIDMHMKLLDEETLLIGLYPASVSDGPQIEANLQYILSNFNSMFGTPYKIIRIVMPPDGGGDYPNAGGDYRTYTNSVFVNKTVILPTYALQYDTTAIRIYQEALPGYNIVGIDCNSIIPLGGAIHCITKEISAADPLLISHQTLDDTYDTVNPYQVDARIQHRSGIASAEIYYRTDTAQPYVSVPMTQGFNPLYWFWTIPAQPAGTRIYYYIHATAVSGKQQVRPMPAPSGYWAFNVLNPTSISENIEEQITIQEIFPNPSHGITCIPVVSASAMKADVSLYDIYGRNVQNIFSGTLKKGDNKFFLNSVGIAPGVYLVTLTSWGQQKTSKLVIR